MKLTQSTKRTAQEIQDNIFRKMTAEQKIALGSKLWRLAKDLVGNKILYGNKRSTTSSASSHQDS